MPQDSLRSTVYRSFVTCDDPKGIVECSTPIKRSKAKIKDSHRRGSSSTSTSCEEESKDLQNLSSYQIKEVSEEARKLNNVIGSWSSHESSKFIAKDLLKGALHLQESLMVLGKLQEASQIVAKSKKGRNVTTRSMDSSRYGDDDKKMSCLKSDPSSRDCYDELRDVITESFARQNLLPKVDSLDRKSLDLSMDFPSSSSSQSSMIPGHSSECSPLESSVRHGKSRGSNLIAKLMGLEEAPSKPFISPVGHKPGKLTNPRNYLVDIDLARPRKPLPMVQKSVTERRTLEEMIETMQFKGLLGRSIEGSDHGDDFPGVYQSRGRSSAVEDPPIVIMKPRQVPDLRAREFDSDYEDKPIDSKRMSRKQAEEFPYRAFDVARARMKLYEMNEKSTIGTAPKRKIRENKEAWLSGESSARLVKKTPDIQNSTSTKINHCKSLPAKVQGKGSVKKIDNKEDCHKRRPAGNGDKCLEPAKTPDQAKTTTSKTIKAARGSNVGKVQAVRGEKTAKEKHMKPKSSKSGIPENTSPKSKPQCNASAAPVENMQIDQNSPTCAASCVPDSARSSTLEETIKQATNPVPDEFGDASCSLCESSAPAITVDVEHTEYRICSTPAPAITVDVDHTEDRICSTRGISNGCRNMSNTRYLLLSSKSFLNLATKISGTKLSDSTISPTTWFPASDIQTLDASVVLDCAEEILEHKRHHHGNALRCGGLSLGQLAEEVANEIEELRSYSKACGESILSDRINAMMRKDLSSKGGVTGNWELGWRNCLSVDQINEVAIDVEKQILSQMMEDIVAHLILQCIC
ncbi:uncharacterized protein LOC127251678 isoform X2 [Andrographis paniculata]|uniref:uncharacterized protein LOC127251678 isoform X2 n=1 Tax=Andrographis paniculata TaxID=175694 RepID=UPI0021E94ADF|nr:uncharacterized protein LOC127251678 isoform X2 [Andrographis paniculata]XP_051131447.1 uncharacterized protein LOC127251678 isoform X2 [Andrographis paniculata]XP_051131448.1 uncharacterized protein LOC127251678 isoform X2 [Andrographis paniculata]XP_051131449.1 uncharacterized protein LOC127251678 isoform X2 [Andrographis paniculata]